MRKRAICLAAAVLLLLAPCGCWSYRGLNEMTIVTGAGIDYEAKDKTYRLSCEIIDPSKTGQESGVRTKLVESQGKSIMDAARSAKKRLTNRLYWGNAQILILGGGLTENGKLDAVMDWFLRDTECRETVKVIASQERSAAEILSAEGLDNAVVSYQIQKILDDDQTNTASLLDMPLYRAYDMMHTPGAGLALPAFRVTENEGAGVVEANGEALFKGGKPAGTLSADESKYFLFAVDGVRGGILTMPAGPEAGELVSLEISENRTNRSYTDQNGKIAFHVKTVTRVYLDESDKGGNDLDVGTIRSMEEWTEVRLEKGIADVVRKVQKESGADVFGFGNLIYQKDPKLWRKLEPGWDRIFPTLAVKVECEVRIANTAFVKGS